MATYNPPLLHDGSLNSVFNNVDFNYQGGTISLSTADARYLKNTGGNVLGTTTLNNATVQNNLNIYNGITSTYATPASGQLGFINTGTVLSSTTANALTNQASLTLPTTGIYFITANCTVGIASLASFQMSISDTSATLNTNSNFSGVNTSSTLASTLTQNLSLIYTNASANKTIYLVSSGSATFSTATSNQVLTAVRIA